MKKTELAKTAIVLIGFLIGFSLPTSACIAEAVRPVPAYPLSLNREIEHLIRSLNDRIIPPKGTSKADVEAVFGRGISRQDGTVEHILLPTTQRSIKDDQDRLRHVVPLQIEYKEDKVSFARIGYGSVADNAQRCEGRYDDYTILRELLTIHDIFCSRLNQAKWNSKTSEHVPGSGQSRDRSPSG